MRVHKKAYLNVGKGTADDIYRAIRDTTIPDRAVISSTSVEFSGSLDSVDFAIDKVLVFEWTDEE